MGRGYCHWIIGGDYHHCMVINTELVRIKPQINYWCWLVAQEAMNWLLTLKMSGWPDDLPDAHTKIADQQCTRFKLLCLALTSTLYLYHKLSIIGPFSKTSPPLFLLNAVVAKVAFSQSMPNYLCHTTCYCISKCMTNEALQNHYR